MLNSIFSGIFDSDSISTVSISDFIICIICALLLGLIIAFAYTLKSRYTRSFVVTLALLPAVVCVVIMMVNGNVGTGVAVAGTFSLVRFRSLPGTARDIGMLFLAMGAGLIAGMGYIAFAFLFVIILCAVFVLYNKFFEGKFNQSELYKTLHITIPEDLDYSEIFDEILGKYSNSWELTRVKTTNMGSLFNLTYNITLKNKSEERELINQLRCRNGNLEISVSKQETVAYEL